MKLTGRLFIDGEDAYTEFGVFVEQYGYKGLVQMPSFKTIDATEWAEYDGEEADLSEPVLDAKTVNIPFCLTDVSKAEDLYSILYGKAYHTFRFADLGKEFKLRMTSTGAFSSLVKKGKMTIAFSDDFPPVPTGSPSGTSMKDTGYTLDGGDFARYGAYVCHGTDDSLRKAAEVRAALKIDAANKAGVTYDDGQSVKFRAKDVTLKLLIHAANVSDFWAKYNALFAVLVAPEEHTLYFPKLEATYKCYYKSCGVNKFEIVPAGRVWCEFSIVLRCIEPKLKKMEFVTNIWVLGADADGAMIVTESDGAAIIIDQQKIQVIS